MNIDELEKALQNVAIIKKLENLVSKKSRVQVEQAQLRSKISTPTASASSHLSNILAKKNDHIRSQNKAKVFEKLQLVNEKGSESENAKWDLESNDNNNNNNELVFDTKR